MTMRLFGMFALMAGLTLTAAGTAQAADPVPTTISIPGLHCGGCAKKVAAKLVTVAGVAKADADMKLKTIKVTPKPGYTPSPKAMWEAVEKADQKPAWMQGPSGTFTSKPGA